MDEPRVAIVGRPNVGKSTLFNRLAGRRKSITASTPGVTRDEVDERAEIGGVPLRLVDTGGFTADAGGELISRIRERCRDAVRTAEVVLFVVDVTEISGEDEELAEMLRPAEDRLLLVANKVDNEKRELLVPDLYRFGLGDPYPVSAEHGIGMRDLEEAIAGRLSALTGYAGAPGSSSSRRTADGSAADAAAPAFDPSGPSVGAREESGEPKSDTSGEDTGAEQQETAATTLAILGQPNTGKSTLLNRLLKEERAIVSESAGTTRDVLSGEFEARGRTFRVLDTAGLRRKSRVREDVEYYSANRAARAVEEADVVLLIIDARQGIVEQDKKIAQIAVRRGRGVILVLNKWDLLEHIPNRLQAMQDRTAFLFPVLSFAPLVAISAQTGEGVGKLLKTAAAVRDQLYRRVETGLLNRKLAEWVEDTPPPLVGRRPLKLRYMTQVGVLPTRFVVFANRSRGIPDSYLSYLKNRIREDLRVPNIPIRLEVRG